MPGLTSLPERHIIEVPNLAVPDASLYQIQEFLSDAAAVVEGLPAGINKNLLPDYCKWLIRVLLSTAYMRPMGEKNTGLETRVAC